MYIGGSYRPLFRVAESVLRQFSERSIRLEAFFYRIICSSAYPKENRKCDRFLSQVLCLIYRVVETVIDYAYAGELTVTEEIAPRILLLGQNLQCSEIVRGAGASFTLGKSSRSLPY